MPKQESGLDIPYHMAARVHGEEYAPSSPRPTPKTLTFHFTPPSHTHTQMGLWEGAQTAKVAKKSVCVRVGVNGG